MDAALPKPPPVLLSYTCDRCGFVYQKSFDYEPFLCYRCMRFIAKRDWVTAKTITPPNHIEREDI